MFGKLLGRFVRGSRMCVVPFFFTSLEKKEGEEEEEEG